MKLIDEQLIANAHDCGLVNEKVYDQSPAKERVQGEKSYQNRRKETGEEQKAERVF